jgi:hypothetical protein
MRDYEYRQGKVMQLLDAPKETKTWVQERQDALEYVAYCLRKWDEALIAESDYDRRKKDEVRTALGRKLTPAEVFRLSFSDTSEEAARLNDAEAKCMDDTWRALEKLNEIEARG